MLRIGGVPNIGGPGDTEYCGLIYPDGDEISKHLNEQLRSRAFYQDDKFAMAMALVQRWRCAVDCGAWVGGWTREMAKRFERVIAIEANPDNARCVRKNTGGNVTVVNAAVGERSGGAALFDTPHASKIATSVSAGGDGSVGILAWRIDDLPEVKALPALDYLKIHVNGMELKALRGAVETIRRHRPVLSIVLKRAIAEYGDTAEGARKFLERELKYRPAGGERPYEVWAPQ